MTESTFKDFDQILDSYEEALKQGNGLAISDVLAKFPENKKGDYFDQVTSSLFYC